MQVWQFIQQKISEHLNVVLLYVLHSHGSSPGRQGFKMAVAEDGSFCGSIGGGMMEHKFMEMAKAKLNADTATKNVYRQVHDKDAGKNKSGMICSGEQTIFLQLVQDTDITHINNMVAALQQNQNGSLLLSDKGIAYSHKIPDENFVFKQYDQATFQLAEKTGYKNVLHIIGGGHCALALSKIMSTLGFYIHVYDERKDLNTMEANHFAHNKHVLDTYSSLHTIIQAGKNVYVVIMTFGYRTDNIALKALCEKQFKYIGLLGSRTKVDKMFSGYAAEHTDATMLATIHSPIGLPIKSQTPEEIAVSIAAEIILVKNKDQ